MITIIMPAYNCEKFLKQAVHSVISQTYTNWKLIIIDDCSTDGTRLLAEELAERDKRIELLCNDQNQGVSRTRNRGIKEAETEWIAFLDSDDAWDKEKLAKQVALMKENPAAELVYTGSAFMRESGELMNAVFQVPERVTRRQLLKQNVISCSSVMIKRDLLLRHPMPEGECIHEDFAVWLTVLGEIEFAYGINEPLLTYRVYQGSKSGNKRRAARMNWNTYRKVGLNPVVAAYYMCWYAVRGIKKHRKLK